MILIMMRKVPEIEAVFFIRTRSLSGENISRRHDKVF